MSNWSIPRPYAGGFIWNKKAVLFETFFSEAVVCPKRRESWRFIKIAGAGIDC